MNLLYAAVDPDLYLHYSAGKAYPDDSYPFPKDVDEVPDFSACTTNNDRINDMTVDIGQNKDWSISFCSSSSI